MGAAPYSGLLCTAGGRGCWDKLTTRAEGISYGGALAPEDDDEKGGREGGAASSSSPKYISATP